MYTKRFLKGSRESVTAFESSRRNSWLKENVIINHIILKRIHTPEFSIITWDIIIRDWAQIRVNSSGARNNVPTGSICKLRKSTHSFPKLGKRTLNYSDSSSAVLILEAYYFHHSRETQVLQRVYHSWKLYNSRKSAYTIFQQLKGNNAVQSSPSVDRV